MKVCELKICGITRAADAADAVEAGVDYAGFVCAEGSPRHLSPERMAEAVRGIPENSGVRRVGVFRNADFETVLRAVRLAHLDVIQLHGSESPAFARAAAGYAEVWKGVFLRAPADVFAAEEYPASRIVCDGRSPGSGIPSDRILARMLSERGVSVMLAGGITPENAFSVWSFVRCAGLDASSGVERSPGLKDRVKIRALVNQLLRKDVF